MRILLRFFVIMISLNSQLALAGDFPELLCKNTKTIFIPFESYESHEISDDKTIYRISSGKIYVNDFERKEYLYGDIEEVKNSYRRYSSNHKTILFDSDYSAAGVVHTSSSDVQISNWSCSESG